jgi:epoxide hydrolase-like predicted phosphatase
VRTTPRGLLVDWGGVLTQRPGVTVEVWARAEGIDFEHYQQLIDAWLDPVPATDAPSPVHALERGELEVRDFERRLARSLRRLDRRPVPDTGLLARMFRYFALAPEMVALVAQIKQTGVRTGLLSNSWGNFYPRDGWDDLFDVVVISGEVGMRKPEPEIFAHATDLLGVAPADCVFVDDLSPNVAAAHALGLTALLHESYHETRNQLEQLFGMTFA